jgi:hypothetical protein
MKYQCIDFEHISFNGHLQNIIFGDLQNRRRPSILFWP